MAPPAAAAAGCPEGAKDPAAAWSTVSSSLHAVYRRPGPPPSRAEMAPILAAAPCPEDELLSGGVSPSSDLLVTRDMLGRTLAGVVRPLALLQRILFFVHPERVLLSRQPPHLRRLMLQDFAAMRKILHHSRFTYTMTGVPVTLICSAPGMWAELFPRFGLEEEEMKQEQLCFAYQPDSFAAAACVMAKRGPTLRTLRVAVAREDTPRGAASAGAAALLFALIARGDFPHLTSLTIVDARGSRPGDATGSFLAPLARPGAAPLRQLRTLRLALGPASSDAHIGCLKAFAARGGLPNLQSLGMLGETEMRVKDLFCSLGRIEGAAAQQCPGSRPSVPEVGGALAA